MDRQRVIAILLEETNKTEQRYDGYRRHLPRQAGTACDLCSFLLRQNVIQYHIKTQFTSAVILERWAESE